MMSNGRLVMHEGMTHLRFTSSYFKNTKIPSPLFSTQKVGGKKSHTCIVKTKLSFHTVEADAANLHHSTANQILVGLTSAVVVINL